ncbi:hypothetical protein MPSEU_000900400 [Mayamaea pseudoterrestris]|nr:hypothetical protein MPSEU_000900400 [Mayamaea pseudoterrestris]
MSRFNEISSRLPPTTFGVIVLCCVLYLVQAIANAPPLQRVTMCPHNVIVLHEYYRIMTSALYHGGLLHITMNMVSTLALSSLLERELGTIRHFLSVLVAILFTSLIYLLVALIASDVFAYNALMYQQAAGFSGVLFHMLVLETSLVGAGGDRTLFGFVNVPSWLYPWVLLVVLQLFMPNLSLLGHLSGMISGHFQLYGIFDVLVLPSEDTLRNMDQWRCLQWLARLPQFAATPSGLTLTRSSVNFPQLQCNCGRTTVRCVVHAMESVKVIIFGRGSVANANIQMCAEQPQYHIGDERDTNDETLSDPLLLAAGERASEMV